MVPTSNNSASPPHRPALSYDNRPTFAGVLLLYRHELRTHWSDNTDNQYTHIFYDLIIPALENHDSTPIDKLTLADYEACVKRIQKEGYLLHGKRCSYDPDTISKIQFLIELVVKTGAKHYLCRNLFASKTGRTKKSAKQRDCRIILRRSLTPGQQHLAESLLLTNSMQPGESMGLALQLELGLRNAESTALTFGDIRAMEGHPEYFFAWVFKSTKINSREIQISGKTRNMDRLVPVSGRLLKLITDRQHQLEALGYDVANMSIACRGDAFSERCSADDLTSASHKFFAQLGITYEQMASVRTIIDEARSEGSSIYGQEVCERSPTAYLLRRNFGTRLALLGLTTDEICFVLGHSIEGESMTRNEFMSDEKLLRIWEKMVGIPSQISTEVELVSNEARKISGSSVSLLFPADCKQAHLHICALEPDQPVHVLISSTDPATPVPEAVVQKPLYYHEKPESYRSVVDISTDYNRLFKQVR